MREVDRAAVEDFGIELLQMMELAGRGLAEVVRRFLNEDDGRQGALVLCGSGNNGGGGMVAARHLHGWGIPVTAILLADVEDLKMAPARQWEALRALEMETGGSAKLPSQVPGLILDAVFGYGFHGEIPAPVCRWTDWANKQSAQILALDLPSGLDASRGTPDPHSIQAAATLTLALPKTGLAKPEAAAYVGDLYLADIGIPREVYKGLGLEVGSIFRESSIVRLVRSEGTAQAQLFPTL